MDGGAGAACGAVGRRWSSIWGRVRLGLQLCKLVFRVPAHFGWAVVYYGVLLFIAVVLVGGGVCVGVLLLFVVGRNVSHGLSQKYLSLLGYTMTDRQE